MRVAAVVSDLMIWSRIESAAHDVRADLVRIDHPADVPPGTDLVLVDWSARDASWEQPLRERRGSARVIVFGPHVDRDAHAAARSAGLGPMWARSKLLASVRDLLAGDRT